ncbi:MAG: cryptochrome/photolyase family protein, partial [Alphaproteobacteria bacterium]|nr:cryptochrome/photolyase family protein [Alphaproteobacteria bacterium]
MKTLRLVLGDQLSRDLPSLTDLDPAKDLVLMAEVMSEVTYVKHHKRKIAYLFSAMRHFAESLGKDGIAVRYRRLDDADNAGSLAGEVAAAIAVFAPDRIVVTAPGEYRLADEMAGWQARFGLAVDIRADTRFLCSLGDFAEWAEGRKSLRMEFFYRDLRRRYQVLMEGDEPIGGKWNYDADNRQPPKAGLAVPSPSSFAPDAITAEVLALVEARCADHFGQLAGFDFAVTRDQALHVLDQFIAERLPLFGTYQDAMIEGEPWMYHSHIGLYLNAGLLSPIEVIRVAEAAYHRGE